MSDFRVFSPGYQETFDDTGCAYPVHDTGRGVYFHQCSRKGVLKYKGYLWCKQHHLPSIEARTKVAPKCQYSYSKDSKCNAILRSGDGNNGKYCKHHRRQVMEDIVYAKVAAYDKLKKLLEASTYDDEYGVCLRETMKLRLRNKP